MRMGIFHLKKCSADDKFKYLVANNVLHTFFIMFLFLWVLSVITNIVIFFIVGILAFGAGLALHIAIKRFNKDEVEEEDNQTD